MKASFNLFTRMFGPSRNNAYPISMKTGFTDASQKKIQNNNSSSVETVGCAVNSNYKNNCKALDTCSTKVHITNDTKNNVRIKKTEINNCNKFEPTYRLYNDNWNDYNNNSLVTINNKLRTLLNPHIYESLKYLNMINQMDVWKKHIISKISDSKMSYYFSFLKKSPCACFLITLNNTIVALLSVIAKGGHSKIWKVFDLKTGSIKAFKITFLSKIESVAKVQLKAHNDELNLILSAKPGYFIPIFDTKITDLYYGYLTKYYVSDLRKVCMSMNNKDNILFKLKCLKSIIQSTNYIHTELNAVHLDIKPANILIDKDGKTTLSDFGIFEYISKVNNGSNFFGVMVDYSNKNNWKGTPNYLSCSHIEAMLEHNKTFIIDKRTDWYAIGCVIYELFTNCQIVEVLLPNRKKDLEYALRLIHMKLSTMRQVTPLKIDGYINVSQMLTHFINELLFNYNETENYMDKYELLYGKLLTELEVE